MKRIALAGNPNSGKSTLFNALTGSTQFVGNWPGVTVEKKEGKTKIGEEQVEVMDLPGIYSLSPYSNEEIISRDYILDEKPDVIVNIVDASNLERNLYLTTQLIELGVPVVVALNMMDIVKSKGEELSSVALANELDCPVCEISAIKKTGIDILKKEIGKVFAEKAKAPEHNFQYNNDVHNAIEELKKYYNAKDESDFYSLKLLSNDEEFIRKHNIQAGAVAKATELRAQIEASYDDDINSIITEQRYNWIKNIIDSIILKRRKESLTLSDKIDKVLTNKWLGLPIFLLIIYVIYFICLNPKGFGKWLVGLTFDLVINCMISVSGAMTEAGVAPWLVSLTSDGVIFGIGIVLAFIPYLMVLFVFLAILEECGYMARVTFIMDRIFRRFGLSGKSFIPMLLGTGCTVQAVAATRTIENENDRKMTILLTPFMPCATKMPVILLIISLMVPKPEALAPLVYLISIGIIILCGILLKNTMLKGEAAPFVMELPEYKLPRIKNIIHFVIEKTISFFKKAATIIFISTVVIWALKYFAISFDPQFQIISNAPIDQSILASIGRFLTPIFMPIGIQNWELVSALITGYVAKENVVATLGIVYGENVFEGLKTLLPTTAQALSFLFFFLLSSPCFASMGAMRKELGSAKETWKAIGFQMITAYLISFVIYWVGTGITMLIK